MFVGGMPDSYSVRRGFDSLQAHSWRVRFPRSARLMARVLLVRRSGFHPGLAGIVTPARHHGSLAVLVKAAA